MGLTHQTDGDGPVRSFKKFCSAALLEERNISLLSFFVDALGECGERATKGLFASFRDVMNQAERENGLVKVYFSSRHYPLLDLNTIPAVVVEEQNDINIRWYANEPLKDIKPRLKREKIENGVLSKAGGGFQWAFLVLSSTRTCLELGQRGCLKRLGRAQKLCPSCTQRYWLVFRKPSSVTCRNSSNG
jgi:hypothetical protein